MSYSDYVRLTERLRDLSRRFPETTRIEEVARSAQARPVWALRLARPNGTAPDERTAILIVAGLDATRVAGTEIALGIAERLAAGDLPTTTQPAGAPPSTEPAEPSDILAEHTLYIVPRLNVDGAERFLGPVREMNPRNATATDDDRDGVADDDPPEDLNGDGLITQMRVRDPEATHISDPDEPRLLRRADRPENEQPVYKLYAEGIDNDGDGDYNEDGAGGVDLNRNLPHAYPALQPDAGRHQLSEPETRGLADYVLQHPNIAAVLVYDRHDNLVHVPGDKARDVSGRGYRDLHPDDMPLYKHISDRFKKLTGLEGAPAADNAGAFYGWSYNQRGLPTFATTAWWVPKKEKSPEVAATQPTSQPTTAPTATAPTTQPATAPATRPVTTAPATTQPAATRPAPVKTTTKNARIQKNGHKKDGKSKKKDTLKTERQWLKYSDDQRSGAGFIDWQPFDHPQLGAVEIGGFVPGFRENPPLDQIPEIVEKQLAFVLDIAARLPKPRVSNCKVTRRADAIWVIELTMTNDGYFPTALAMARTAGVAYPFVLRLDLPPEDLLGGRRVHKIPFIGGLGAVEKVRWLVRAAAGTTVTATIYHKRFGTLHYAIRLEPNTEGDGP
ncbi:MAG: M14 family metallopeptidase [Phycisphaerae bacterium]